MAQGKKNEKMMFEGSWYSCCGSDLMMMKKKNDKDVVFDKWTYATSSLSSSSIGEDSSAGSCISSSDTVDDASSSDSVSVSSNSNGSLYDLSEIMAQLPIKRGLSKYYQGKSESFTSLSRVTSIEDLAKKTHGAPHRRELKASKSCGNGLNSSRYKPYSNKSSFSTIKTTTIPPH